MKKTNLVISTDNHKRPVNDRTYRYTSLITLCFIALYRCSIYCKPKTNPSTSKKKKYNSLYCDTHFSVVSGTKPTMSSGYASTLFLYKKYKLFFKINYSNLNLQCNPNKHVNIIFYFGT